MCQAQTDHPHTAREIRCISRYQWCCGLVLFAEQRCFVSRVAASRCNSGAVTVGLGTSFRTAKWSLGKPQHNTLRKRFLWTFENVVQSQTLYMERGASRDANRCLWIATVRGATVLCVASYSFVMQLIPASSLYRHVISHRTKSS